MSNSAIILYKKNAYRVNDSITIGITNNKNYDILLKTKEELQCNECLNL